MLRKILGVSLLASPFVAWFVITAATNGVALAVGILVACLVIAAVIFAGLWLLDA